MRGSRKGKCNGNGNGDGEEEKLQAVKRERLSENAEQEQQNPVTRRIIRSEFLKLKTIINEKKDDLMSTDSEKFDSILNEFDKLHDQVEKPREQVADAEALLDLTRTLVGSVRSLSNEGITPSQFVSSLFRRYGQGQDSINWQKLGLAVSPIFLTAHGSSTMLGPMENQFKQRKTGAPRKRPPRPTATSRPQQLDEALAEEKTDTDKNMSTMFDILRRLKRVRLENLILNRTSFAQTVENLFALSFLVKDGRAEINLDENRIHYVVPRNAPRNASAGNVSYAHFVFRYDYKDWKLMKDMVPDGVELMPHRIQCCTVVASQEEVGGDNSQSALAVTPIRKLSRNRGLVVQEEGVVEESPECDEEHASRAAAIRRCKRKLH